MIMDDPDPIPRSALQHWAYCPRQCGLIHLEQAFDENLRTQRGQVVHALVDKPGVEERKGLRNERALPLWSDALCLESMTGRAVTEGSLYYASSRRRRLVPITQALREQVAETTSAVRAMLGSAKLPPPTQDVRRCKGCSLRERCQPEARARLQSADFSRDPFDPEA